MLSMLSPEAFESLLPLNEQNENCRDLSHCFRRALHLERNPG